VLRRAFQAEGNPKHTNPSICDFRSFNLPRQVFYLSFQLSLLIFKLHDTSTNDANCCDYLNDLINRPFINHISSATLQKK